jgi:S1-C subfamily serine protease
MCGIRRFANRAGRQLSWNGALRGDFIRESTSMKRFSLGLSIALRLAATGLLFLTTAQSSAAQDTSSPRGNAQLYETAKAASVEVLVNGHLNGSGCFVDPDGIVLTAAHVIEDPGRRLEVNNPRAGRLAATVLAVDLGHDLALLKVESPNGRFAALEAADQPPEPGADVFLMGAPIYRHAVLLPGKTASAGTTFEYYADHYIEITHFAATVPMGMSGGPWLDSTGRLVGIQSGVMSQNSIPVGIAFVAPLSSIRRFVKDRQTAATPTLGLAVDELWQQDRKTLDRFPPDKEGLVVSGLQDDGPAARSGLKRGDLIVAAGGKKVRLSEELQRIVLDKQPGESLELTALGPDGTGERKLSAKLGTLETRWQRKAEAGKRKDD